MLKTLILGVAALAIVGGAAFAENAVSDQPSPVQVAQADDNSNDAPPPPPGNDGPQANNGGGGRGWWEWHHRWNGEHGGPDRGGPGMKGQGGPGMRGPGGPGMMMGMGPHNGFRLRLGKGIDVGVMCGKAEMKDCIASAQPLIDAAKAAAQAQASAPAKQ